LSCADVPAAIKGCCLPLHRWCMQQHHVGHGDDGGCSMRCFCAGGGRGGGAEGAACSGHMLEACQAIPHGRGGSWACQLVIMQQVCALVSPHSEKLTRSLWPCHQPGAADVPGCSRCMQASQSTWHHYHSLSAPVLMGCDNDVGVSLQGPEHAHLLMVLRCAVGGPCMCGDQHAAAGWGQLCGALRFALKSQPISNAEVSPVVGLGQWHDAP
jgi:hypothetical protein